VSHSEPETQNPKPPLLPSHRPPRCQCGKGRGATAEANGAATLPLGVGFGCFVILRNRTRAALVIVRVLPALALVELRQLVAGALHLLSKVQDEHCGRFSALPAGALSGLPLDVALGVAQLLQ